VKNKVLSAVRHEIFIEDAAAFDFPAHLWANIPLLKELEFQ
jgi:hypothetical protein